MPTILNNVNDKILLENNFVDLSNTKLLQLLLNFNYTHMYVCVRVGVCVLQISSLLLIL